MPIMEISVVPLGTKKPSVSKYVQTALKVLKKEKNIKYQLTAMATIVESNSLEKLLDIAKKMHRSIFSKEVKRVLTSIKIDDREDKNLTIEGKLKSVQGFVRD